LRGPSLSCANGSESARLLGSVLAVPAYYDPRPHGDPLLLLRAVHAPEARDPANDTPHPPETHTQTGTPEPTCQLLSPNLSNRIPRNELVVRGIRVPATALSLQHHRVENDKEQLTGDLRGLSPPDTRCAAIRLDPLAALGRPGRRCCRVDRPPARREKRGGCRSGRDGITGPARRKARQRRRSFSAVRVPVLGGCSASSTRPIGGR
jgi:hypothetical protein